MGRLELSLITVCVLLGRASCDAPQVTTTTDAPEVTATAATATASSSSGPDSEPESTSTPPHPEPSTAAETSDAGAAVQRDATIDQVISELDGFYQSAGRAATAGPFAALTNALAGIQSSLAAVSSRLDVMQASQVEMRELHNSLEKRLDTFQTEVSSQLAKSQTEVSSRLEKSQTEVSNRLIESQTEVFSRLTEYQTEVSSRLAEVQTKVSSLAESQTEVSSRLAEVQSKVSSRLAEFQTEVSSRLDAVQAALSADRDGLRRWQTETDDTLASMRQRLANLTGGLGDWRASVESAQTALPERVAAVLQQSPTCSGQPDQSSVQTQLEDILTAVGRIPKAVLGEACTRDTDCSRWLPEATCSASGVCTCRDGYRQVSSLQCRQHSRLDEVCLEDADCQTLAANSSCRNGRCSCGSGRWNYNNTECRRVAAVNMGGRCVGDQDCQSRLNHRCTSGSCSCVTRAEGGYEYRLVGGPSCSEGNVELRQTGGSWGQVCDDDWSTPDAQVLCRSLGFTSGQSTNQSQYGQGTRFFMDDVKCSGWEGHLVLCPYRGWGSHNCGAGEVAGVRCQN